MVQAPQSPSAHPSFVPVRCARVRSQSSTVMLGGALSSLHGMPFSRNCTAVMAGAYLMSRFKQVATADRPCKPRTNSHGGCEWRGPRYTSLHTFLAATDTRPLA